MTKRIPRPGDYIKITDKGHMLFGQTHIVVDARYINGIRFSLSFYAWIWFEQCEYAGTARDKEFFSELEKSGIE